MPHSSTKGRFLEKCLKSDKVRKKTLYEKDMITELDMVLRNDYARKEGEAIGEARGRAEGEARGKAEEQSAIARRMLEDNVPVEVIAKYSGLSEDEVRKLM